MRKKASHKTEKITPPSKEIILFGDSEGEESVQKPVHKPGTAPDIHFTMASEPTPKDSGG